MNIDKFISFRAFKKIVKETLKESFSSGTLVFGLAIVDIIEAKYPNDTGPFNGMTQVDKAYEKQKGSLFKDIAYLCFKIYTAVVVQNGKNIYACCFEKVFNSETCELLVDKIKKYRRI